MFYKCLYLQTCDILVYGFFVSEIFKYTVDICVNCINCFNLYSFCFCVVLHGKHNISSYVCITYSLKRFVQSVIIILNDHLRDMDIVMLLNLLAVICSVS